MTRWAAGLGFVISLWLAVPPAALADRPVCTDAPSDAEVRRRLAIVQRHVREEEPSVRRWFASFAVLHGVMASGAGLLAGFSVDDEGFRNEMLVGATSSTLALLSIVVVLPPLLGAGDQIGGVPDDTREGRLARLRVAEDLLRRGSDAVDFIQGWFPITLTSLYSASASVFNLVALERTRGAYTHAIGGAVIGLGRVLLRPTGARARWRRYRAAFPDAACLPVASAPGPSLRVSLQGAGLGLRLDF